MPGEASRQGKHITRTASEDGRIALQLSATQKSRLAKAAAIGRMDMARFVREAALREADAVIGQADTTSESERDFTRVLELLERPPAPNARLKAAIAALPDTL